MRWSHFNIYQQLRLLRRQQSHDSTKGGTYDTARHLSRDSTSEDWIIRQGATRFSAGLPKRILAHLKLLEGDYGGFPIDRYTHCFQTATLAMKDGPDGEYVVCALLHDIGDTLGTYNQTDIAAAILEPFVSDANHWMIKQYGIFHGHNFFHHIGLNRRSAMTVPLSTPPRKLVAAACSSPWSGACSRHPSARCMEPRHSAPQTHNTDAPSPTTRKETA